MAEGCKQRGRPPSTKHAKADAIIGRTVWQLLWWGFSLRDQVAPAVATAAAAVLGRTDSYGLVLSVERVEQIYEGWRDAAPSGWVRDGQSIPGARRVSGVSKEWRGRNRPGVPLPQLAEELLRCGGKLPGARMVPLGDPEPTAGARELTNRPRFGADPEDDKTG